MNGLRDEQQELGKKELELKRDLEYLPGQHEAGEKEFEKEVALAEMKRAIESYVPLKASTIVLNWAIEKFQKEKQDPILTRASEIFKTLTLDSFTRLELQIGVARPALIALRSNGNAVAVQGLSEGTADQLYLALRLAAIEDYVKQSKAALPLVVDDLFTTFDDDRARAGFEVLHELSRTCQVLFFTHHQHLVEIVQSILGEELSVHSI